MKTAPEFDLTVVGGGTAGVFCAIAAARSGLKTAIIEKSFCLGGMATAAGLTEMNAAGFQSKPLYRGIEAEIFGKMIQGGHAEYHFAVPMSSNPDVKVDRLRYNPEILKIILEEACIQAGVTIFYRTEFVEGTEEDGYCRIQVKDPYRQLELSTLYLADATGNAELTGKLGAETTKTPKEQQLTATLMFRLSNVDLGKLNTFLESGMLKEIIANGYQEGILKGKILAFTPIPGTNDVSLNVTRTSCDYEDVLDYSKGIAEARSQILPILAYIKEHVPGTGDSYLSNIAPILGVRDGRRICGEYELTLHDLEQMTEFEDSIACGCYPMDIHDPVTKAVIWKVLPGVYHIPYRSLLPKGLHRTLAIGKCLSAEKKAFAAIRVMPIMMNVGESAGYLYALAKEKGCQMTELTPDDIRKYLQKKYDETGDFTHE